MMTAYWIVVSLAGFYAVLAVGYQLVRLNDVLRSQSEEYEEIAAAICALNNELSFVGVRMSRAVDGIGTRLDRVVNKLEVLAAQQRHGPSSKA
jgi:hypothetical protein